MLRVLAINIVPFVFDNPEWSNKRNSLQYRPEAHSTSSSFNRKLGLQNAKWECVGMSGYALNV
jgi:hypothetical protein